jgi:outer membrane exchange protein TraA
MPIPLYQSSAAGPVRTDPGSGLCGAAVHFKAQGTPLLQLSQAITLLDSPSGSSAILARSAALVASVNFRNASGSAAGDFTAPTHPVVLFPYSNDPAAQPPGDDVNLAVRLRGYLNITSSLAAGTVTFALNCDDACALKIGTKDIIPFANELSSARVAQQVRFQDPGLYPVEIVYYQNGSLAYLEWSRALGAEPDGNRPSPLDQTKFQLLAATDLYSATVGSNAACQECGALGQSCAPGTYCSDGLCQSCNVPAHCGATCLACPSDAAVCDAGRCVQCATDDQCPTFQLCDSRLGTCGRPAPCTRTPDCGPGLSCYPTINRCLPFGDAEGLCFSDAGCRAGDRCNPVGLYCYTPPASCATDEDCPADAGCAKSWGFLYAGCPPGPSHCDVQHGCCQPGAPAASKGASGCAIGPREVGGRSGALLAFLLTALAGLSVLRARRSDPPG